jgi:hypothetical protein
MKGKKVCPLATRIKKMMQTDDDVGKISQATPVLIGAWGGCQPPALVGFAAPRFLS